jgi:hypothetical protein
MRYPHAESLLKQMPSMPKLMLNNQMLNYEK